MNRRIRLAFLVTVLAPALCSLWAIVSYTFIQLGTQWKHLPYMLPSILAPVAMVTVPGALIFLAARLSLRASFASTCLYITVPFAVVFCLLSQALGSGPALLLFSVLETLIAVVTLLLAANSRKSAHQGQGK